MGVIQCGECGESVDEAKAFCPECGSSLITEEGRKDTSSFEQHESTVQFGQTMFDQMLSDMGLKGPIRAEEQVAPDEPAVEVPEIVQPATAAQPPMVTETPTQTGVATPAETKTSQPEKKPVEPPPKKRVAMIAPIETGSNPQIVVAPAEVRKAKPSKTKWIILGLSILALIGVVVVAVAAVAFYFYWFRLR